jgi:alpha-beta hydrolase superfamily lysophospholipase
VLVVDPRDRSVVGLANQVLHKRVAPPPGETKAEGVKRESRESRLWPRSTAPLPNTEKLIVICDRGGDTFEELEHEHLGQRGFVVRAGAHPACRH